MKKTFISGLILIITSTVFAEQIKVKGQINAADCDKSLVQPVKNYQKEVCIVSYTGTALQKGGRGFLQYKGQLAVIAQALNPLSLIDKSAYLTIDDQTKEVLDWTPRSETQE
ncbi:MAG: hypothetical protein ACXWRE_07545 [Pseudobdellovibrionaceae bacterium]